MRISPAGPVLARTSPARPTLARTNLARTAPARTSLARPTLARITLGHAIGRTMDRRTRTGRAGVIERLGVGDSFSSGGAGDDEGAGWVVGVGAELHGEGGFVLDSVVSRYSRM